MNIEQIIKLIDAGYTRDEINSMLQPAAADPEPVPEPEKKSAPAEQPAAPAAQATDPALMQAITELTKSIKAMNIVNGASTVPDEKKNLDNALDKLLKGGR